jgi:hypothetical protein
VDPNSPGLEPDFTVKEQYYFGKSKGNTLKEFKVLGV